MRVSVMLMGPKHTRWRGAQVFDKKEMGRRRGRGWGKFVVIYLRAGSTHSGVVRKKR